MAEKGDSLFKDLALLWGINVTLLVLVHACVCQCVKVQMWVRKRERMSKNRRGEQVEFPQEWPPVQGERTGATHRGARSALPSGDSKRSQMARGVLISTKSKVEIN